MSAQNRRNWERFPLERPARLKVNNADHTRDITDVSAGGASLRGQVVGSSADEIEIGLEDFGEFSATVVRQWDNGFAVMFEIAEEDQYSLQEDVESFMRENDLFRD